MGANSNRTESGYQRVSRPPHRLPAIMRIALKFCLCLSLFAVLSYLFVRSDTISSINQFNDHAAIIADDVWAFNKSSAQSYLRLALLRDHYKTIVAKTPEETVFLELKHSAPDGLDGLLLRFGLITTREMYADITYNNRIIGKLTGERYVRIIYPLINSLVALLFLALSGNYVFRLFRNRKQLELQLQEGTKNLEESELRFQDLVNLLPEMVWETDRHGHVLYANHRALERLGMDENKPGQLWFLSVTEENRQEAMSYFHDIINGDSTGLREFRAEEPGGKTFPMLVRSVPWVREDAIVGARYVAIDITERHEMEDQLRRAQSMKAIGLMAGGVAHDLNNLLSGIVTYPELLLLELPPDDPMRPAIETIHRSGVAASEVVSDLLTVARGVAAVRENWNINELIEEYLDSPEYRNLCSLYPELKLKFNPGKHLPLIYCSGIHIRKCLMNLIMNAAEAITGKGQIIVSSRYEDISAEEATVYSLNEGNHVLVVITDNGHGIPAENLEHIFEPFYTKKVMGRSGTGLGLTVVWNTIKDHEGAVRVESGSQGTTFELIFPAVTDSESETAAVKDTLDWRQFCGNGQHILVVDDEFQQREIAEKLLRSLHYSVEAVESGEKAIDYLTRNKADLLLIDMLMEPGINGRNTYEQVIKMHPKQKAVIVSGFSQSEDVRATLKMGAGAFLGKPYGIAELGRTIYQELNGIH